MRFPPDFVEKIREANNIVDVIGQYTQLRPSGSNFMGRCPFPDHSDKTASFSVSEDKQLYNCFGCKKSGNLFTFLQVFNGYSFPEAIEYLARRANIALPLRDEDAGEKRIRELREAVMAANRLAASFFADSFAKLPETHPARVYAKGRGLEAEIVEGFRIGYAPDDWHALTKVLRARRIPLEVGEKGGLLKRSTRGTASESHFDLFRGRLMFPILTTGGDVVGFGGRVVGEGEPKYLNSPETPVFHKGRVLYGLDVTARHIRSEDEAIIVEGYMDAVALYRAGIRNVAAILGTAFTPEHGKLIRRMTPNVVMLLDGDAAGIQGAERSLPALLAADIRPRGLILPEGMDPDDFVRAKGVEALRSEMESAGDLFTLLLTRHWMKGYRATAQDKLRVVEAAARALRGANSAVSATALLDRPLAELFVAEIAKYLDVDALWVRKTLIGRLHAVGNVGHSEASAMGLGKASEVVDSTGAISGDDYAATGPKSAVERAGDVDSKSFPRRISLDGASREELVALGLLLQSEGLMQDMSEASKDWAASGAGRDEHPIAVFFDHEGARKLAGVALRKYGQQPEAVATLAASLIEFVAQPELLTKGLADAIRDRAGESGSMSGEKTAEAASERTTEQDRKHMAKILSAIQRRRKQAELNQISLRLREIRGPEQNQELMERFVTVQRELRAIESELRSPELE